MIVLVALRVHHPAAMPEGRPPAAPILMSIVSIKNEPTPFHLRITELHTAPTGHLAFAERKVHVLRSVSMKIINP